MSMKNYSFGKSSSVMRTLAGTSLFLSDESGVSIGYFHIYILVYMECGKGSHVDDCNNKFPFEGQNNLYQVSAHRMQCG